jgi:hypothetical protein
MSKIEKNTKPSEKVRESNSLHEERRGNWGEILERIKMEPGEAIVYDGDGFVYTENMDESNRGQ